MIELNLRDDIRLIQNARRNAYVRKDEVTVGAVIKTKSGRKYTGCNIEVSETEMVWAEKVSITKAISEGEKDFDYIVVMAGKKDKEPEKYLPDEKCKEFIKNFVDENFKVYVIYDSKIEEYRWSDLVK